MYKWDEGLQNKCHQSAQENTMDGKWIQDDIYIQI